MEYSVKTKILDEKTIEQRTIMNDEIQNMVHEISRKVVSLEEEGLKEALIELGWTPPSEISLSQMWIYSAVKRFEEIIKDQQNTQPQLIGEVTELKIIMLLAEYYGINEGPGNNQKTILKVLDRVLEKKGTQQ